MKGNVGLKILLLLLVLCALLISCSSKSKDVEVAPENTYSEMDDAGNGENPESTGLSVTKGEWIAIEGTFANRNDEDQYRVDIGGSDFNRLSFVVLNDGEVDKGMFGIVTFPMDAVQYLHTETGTVLPASLNLLAATGFQVHENAEYVVFTIRGKAGDDGEGAYKDGPYVIKITGEYREPQETSEEADSES